MTAPISTPEHHGRITFRITPRPGPGWVAIATNSEARNRMPNRLGGCYESAPS